MATFAGRALSLSRCGSRPLLPQPRVVLKGGDMGTGMRLRRPHLQRGEEGHLRHKLAVLQAVRHDDGHHARVEAEVEHRRPARQLPGQVLAHHMPTRRHHRQLEMAGGGRGGAARAAMLEGTLDCGQRCLLWLSQFPSDAAALHYG